MQVAADCGQRPELLVVERALRAALGIERLGVPQDIEWAIEDGRLFVLQARPVTA